MEVQIVHGSITDIECDVLIVNLFEGVTLPGGATGAVDRALNGMISESIALNETTGKLMECTILHTLGKIAPKRVLVVGLGKSSDFNAVTVGKVAGAAARFARAKGAKTITTIVHGAGIGNLDARRAARAIVEGTMVGLYRSSLYKKSEDDNEIDTLTIVEFDESKIPAIEAGVQEGRILGRATNEARTLGNEPSNKMTPIDLAAKAKEMADETGLEFEALDESRIAELHMGGLLGVAQGSVQSPRLIVLRYKYAENKPTLALLGKGITFDSGGISIKPSDAMQDMKFDMAGGAAVIQAMRAIAELKPAINVIGVIPATENMPSGSAYKPGDVIRFMNGKTSEITTTDAEGRVVLADAITYAIQQGANFIVDIATLTGGCVVALGHGYCGIMGNDRQFIKNLCSAAENAGERVWELPLPADYMHLLESNIADFTNAGGRAASAIQGGLFLQEFAEGIPWIHMDIAGTSDITHGNGPYEYKKFMDEGATGFGVRTLTMLAKLLG